MGGTSFAAVAFFRRHRDLGHSTFSTLIAPVIAGVALIAMLIVAIANFDIMIGNTGYLSWLLPSLLVIAAIAGADAAQVVKKRSPELFASIGRHRE